jgi:hypothetical protein
MTNAELQELAQLLKALGEYNRLSLVYQLCSCSLPEKCHVLM